MRLLPITSCILRGLLRFSTWILCSVIVVFFFRSNPTSTLTTAREHELQSRGASDTRDGMLQSEPLVGRSGEEGHHLTRRVVLPDSMVKAVEAAPNGDGYDEEQLETARNQYPYFPGWRRMVGDLETCVEDLMPYTGEESAVDQDAAVKIRPSGLRSCREAIATFLRWVKDRGDLGNTDPPDVNSSDSGKNSRILRQRQSLDEEMNEEDFMDEEVEDSAESAGLEDYPFDTSVSLDGVKEVNTFVEPERKVATKAAILEFPEDIEGCRKSICDSDQIVEMCTTPRKAAPEEIPETCKMCKPRDEGLIEAYCLKQARRERQSFYVLSGMLGVAICGLGIIIYVNDRRKRAAEAREMERLGEPKKKHFRFSISTFILQKWREWKQRRELHRLQNLHRLKQVSDLESRCVPENTPLPGPVELKPFDPFASCQSLLHDEAKSVLISKPRLLKLRKGKTEPLGDEEKVLVMPRTARTTSAQMPNDFHTLVGNTEEYTNTKQRPRYATYHASSPPRHFSGIRPTSRSQE